MTGGEPIAIFSLPAGFCLYEEDSKKVIVDGTVYVIQSETETGTENFLDIMPTGEGEGLTIPLTNETEMIYDQKVVLTTKPVSHWTITIDCEDRDLLGAFIDVLQNILGGNEQLPTHLDGPNQSLVWVRDGKVLSVVESEVTFDERIPDNLATDATLVIDSTNSKVEPFEPTKSQTVRLGRTLGNGIVMGAELLGSGIKAGASMIVKNSAPTTQNTKVSPQTIQRVKDLQKYSGQAASMTKMAATTVKNAAGTLGGMIAGAVSSNDSKKDKSSSLWKLARNTSMAIDAIGDGFEKAMVQLVDDSKAASSEVIKHKYGEEAVVLSNSTMDIVRNATLMYIDVNGISRKAIVKGIRNGAMKAKFKSK